jgi:hypothetical protein
MKRLVLSLAALVAAAGSVLAGSGVDINGGLSWNGWSYRGNSLDAGIWGASSTTRSFDIYTTEFTFNNNAITGSPTQVQAGGTPAGFAAGTFSTGAFANGNRILGIGLKMNGSARAVGETFVKLGLQGNDFRAASALGVADGRVSVSQWGRTGDFSMWMQASAGPSNLAVLTSNGTQQGGAGTITNLVGGYGSGVSYDFAFRQFRQGDVGGSTQMFFDLTAMQNLYGGGPNFITSGWSGGASPIGLVGTSFSIAIYNADAGNLNATEVAFGFPTSRFTPICFGDGSGIPCPCGNDAPVGSGTGCLNSNGTGGLLTASGTASLSNDTLSFAGSGMISSFAVYIQGTQANNSGLGAVLGDGKLCVSNSLIRLSTVFNTGGVSTYPNATNPAPVSVRGAVTAPGVRTYQIYYRNPIDFCTTATFNLSNGLVVTWTL